MKDFWNNVSRYPRFFISSIVGLILIIITPLKNLFKVKELQIFLIIALFLFVTFLYITIEKMVGL